MPPKAKMLTTQKQIPNTDITGRYTVAVLLPGMWNCGYSFHVEYGTDTFLPLDLWSPDFIQGRSETGFSLMNLRSSMFLLFCG